jgi:spore maturation protein CgeB
MTTTSLTEALGYSKFRAGETPRMLVLESEYFLVRDVIQSAQAMGWSVQTLPIKLEGEAESEMLKSLLMELVRFQPDFLLTINHIGFDEAGVLAGILEDYGIPICSWFVDHPLPILGGAEQNATSNTQLFCYERTALPWLARIGFEDPRYLPTASNPEQFHPSKVDASISARMGRPLNLVAGSWFQRARLDVTPEGAEFARQLAIGRTVDRKFLRDDLARLLEQNAPEHGRALFMAAQITLGEATLQSRVELVRELADLGLVVYGDTHWEKLVEGVELPGAVHPTRELPSVFAGSDVNLNITAMQMPTALNKRVWDVPGSGGFLLTDSQADLFEFFETGVDVATFSCTEEAAEKARFYLDNPAARAKVAAAGFERVEKAHRTHHRLQSMVEVLAKRFG